MKANTSLSRWFSSALLAGMAASCVCRADTVFLTDGREVNGTIVNEDPLTVVIKTNRGLTRSIRRSEIDTIVRDKRAASEPAVAKKDETRPTNAPADATRPESPGNRVVPTGPTTSGTSGTSGTAGTSGAGGVAPAAPSGASGNTAAAAGATTGEAPITNFPENSKRMSKRKEALFSDAMATIKVAYKNPEDKTRGPAMSDIKALGVDVMPYLWAGVQNDDPEVRVACMSLIGQLNGRTCIKRVIETFYMTMPEASAAATWNVPLVDETIKTLVSITSQTFVTVEARRLGVQDGLKKYIEWYNASIKSLPHQIGEPELDPTDVDFDSKLAKLRQLKLTKKEWPRTGGLPVDLVAGPNKNGPEKPPAPIIKDAERAADKKYAETVPTVSENKALKRPRDLPEAPNDRDALRRPQDDAKNPANSRRDPSSSVPSQTVEQPDPLSRPVDRLKQQQQQQNQ